MYRFPADTYAHGGQIDPAAEAELREWARSQPSDEPEFAPVVHHPADFYPVLHADDRSLGEHRRMYDEGCANARYHDRYHESKAGVFGG